MFIPVYQGVYDVKNLEVGNKLAKARNQSNFSSFEAEQEVGNCHVRPSCRRCDSHELSISKSTLSLVHSKPNRTAYFAFYEFLGRVLSFISLIVQ